MIIGMVIIDKACGKIEHCTLISIPDGIKIHYSIYTMWKRREEIIIKYIGISRSLSGISNIIIKFKENIIIEAVIMAFTNNIISVINSKEDIIPELRGMNLVYIPTSIITKDVFYKSCIGSIISHYLSIKNIFCH